MDDSGYGIGPEFTLDTRDNVVVPPDGGGEPTDVDDSGYGIGPEFTLDTRDNVVVPPDGGEESQRMWMIVVMGLD